MFVQLFERTGGIPGFPSQAAAVPLKSFGGSRSVGPNPETCLDSQRLCRALISAVVALDANSPKPSLHGVANEDLSGSICMPVIKAGLCINRSDSPRAAECASNFNLGEATTSSIDARFVETSG